MIYHRKNMDFVESILFAINAISLVFGSSLSTNNVGTKTLGRFRVFRNFGYPNGTKFLKEKTGFAVSTENAMRCGALCMYNPQCMGYFFRTNEFCRLISTYKRVITEYLGTDYYEIWNQCDLTQHLCNGGKCIPSNNNSSFTCQYQYFVVDNTKNAKYYHSGGSCISESSRGTLLYQGTRVTQAYRLKLDGISSFNTITSAKLFLTVKSNNDAFSYDIKIKAMKRADSTTDIKDECELFIDNTLRTTTQVVWSGAHPATSVDDVIETPDISAVLNEVISMNNWMAGNHVDIVFFNDELSNRSDESAYSCYAGNVGGTKRPKLVLTIIP